MVKSEVSKILTIIASVYPKFYIPEDEEKATYKVDIWYSFLKDLDYNVAQLAVQKLVMTNKFPPSIAEIREIAAKIASGESASAGEAWGEVESAIHRYGSCRYDATRLEEAMNSLSETTRRVVKWMNWTEICDSENLGVVRGQFMKIYDTESKRVEERKSLPPQLIKQIQMISNRSINDLKVIEGGK